MTTTPGPDLDPTWACEARRVRRAAELLGWPELSRCLPDEPDACGYGFAQHAASYYMILCVIADHQLHQHICMPHDQQEKLYTGLHADMAANCEHSAPADSACCQDTDNPPRHLLRLERYPGKDAVLTIDGQPCRVVRLKVTPDVTDILYEAG